MCLPEYTKLTVFRANTQVRPYRVSREQNFEFLSFNFNFYIDIHSGPDSIPYLLLTRKEYLAYTMKSLRRSTNPLPKYFSRTI